jgi:hypothetical protein
VRAAGDASGGAAAAMAGVRSAARCRRVSASGLRASGGRPDPRADVFLLLYLDVCLVLATAPVVLVAGLPLLGYAIAAGAWLLTRAGNVYMLERARSVSDPKLRAGLQVGAMMGRLWLIGAAVILARVAGGKDDGIMAAALLLAAFTVYFAMSLFTRGGSLTPRAPARGRPSPS